MLEYICLRRKAMSHSRSSVKAFVSEANETNPAKRIYFVKYLSHVNENRTNISREPMKIRKNNNKRLEKLQTLVENR